MPSSAAPKSKPGKKRSYALTGDGNRPLAVQGNNIRLKPKQPVSASSDGAPNGSGEAFWGGSWEHNQLLAAYVQQQLQEAGSRCGSQGGGSYAYQPGSPLTGHAFDWGGLIHAVSDVGSPGR
jgi:hypothetical protein